MRTKVVAAIAAAALAAALAGCAPTGDAGSNAGTPGGGEGASLADCQLTMIPKNTDNPFFAAAAFGANEAAAELGGPEVNYTGTAQPDVPGQIQRIQSATQQKACAIAVSGLDPDALAPSLKQADAAGTTVVAFDADVATDARRLWITGAADEALGVTQFQLLAEQMGNKGKYAIISAQSTAAGQNAWIEAAAEEAQKPEYSEMELVKTVYGNDVPQTSYDAAVSLFQAYPDLEGVLAITPVALAAAVKAKADQNVDPELVITGLGWPPSDGALLKDGTLTSFVLWSPRAMGYVTYYAVQALLTGEITGAEGDTFEAGSYGTYTVGADGEIDAGEPIVFTAENVDDQLENFRTE
ncbi:substrate-binding domain-containing protein [Microbacterium aerolatum]|uniref:substrate-binding domain-containing protein n=1 Tax=Microbacterium aerolatum TaxID=153731 RepID=UPI0038514BE7